MLPSVEGRRRAGVGILLVLSATLAGAVVGGGVAAVAAGVASLATGDPLPLSGAGSVAVALVGVAVVLDLVHRRIGRPAPLAVGTQVPIVWGRILPPAVVAVLYGTRLGIGPATILSTWLWWASTIGAALLGVWPGVLVGVTFGLVRGVTTIATSIAGERIGPAVAYTRLRALTRRAWGTLDGVAAVGAIVLVVVLASCTSSPEVETADPTGSTVDPEEPMTDSSTTAASPSTTAPTTPGDTDDAEPGFTESSLTDSTAPLVTTPDDVEPRPAADDDELAALLLADVSGFDPVDDPAADRALDLEAASALQPDPTEERPLLETRGFRNGWTRAFRNDDREVLVTTVYDFVSALEAEFYLEDGTITLVGDGATIYEVDAIPGARGFRQDLAGDEPLVVYGITFTRANRWYLLTLLGDPDETTTAPLLAAAAAQAEAAG